jgi:hypothetical protein
MAMYGPSTCTELNVIAGSLGGAGVFAGASFCTFTGTALGAASIGRAVIARLVAGVDWAAIVTLKLNVAAQPNSKQ